MGTTRSNQSRVLCTSGSLGTVTECEESDRRVIGMRSERETVNHAVAGIPPATRTSPIKQHFNPESYARRNSSKTARTRQLIESENRKRSRHNPTVRVRYPWPAELVRIEAHMAIGGTKLPSPEPMRFLSCRVHEPGKAFQPLENCINFIVHSDEHKSGSPRPLLVIALKSRPASVRVLHG
jgi:hypothetical protein